MRNFENLKKKSQNSALYSTQWLPDNWPDVLDCLAIGLVANKCTKLAKISEILLLSLGLSYMKIPLCYIRVANFRLFLLHRAANCNFRGFYCRADFNTRGPRLFYFRKEFSISDHCFLLPLDPFSIYWDSFSTVVTVVAGAITKKRNVTDMLWWGKNLPLISSVQKRAGASEKEHYLVA